MTNETKGRDELVSLLSHYSGYGSHFQKGVDAVAQGSVKRHLFRPSGRAVYSVVGNIGDEFVDLERPFCSCSHFFYRVLSGQDELCYHLLGLRMAIEVDAVDEILFDDEEYEDFLALLAYDILNSLNDKEDKGI